MQVGGKLIAGRITLVGSLGEGFSKNSFQNAGQGRVPLKQGIGIIFQDSLRNQVALKRMMISKELEKTNASGKQVGTSVARMALDLFRRHVIGRAEDCTRTRQVRCRELRDTEIHDLRAPI